MKFVALARSHGETTEQGIQLAIQAMLVTPHFLFRIEHDPDPADAQDAHRISDVELASRLSYFLWSSMPDDELMGWPKRASCTILGPRRTGEAHDGGSAARRLSPTISPANGWRSAIWTW